jgi:TRAP-type transport system periplasmic protein
MKPRRVPVLLAVSLGLLAGCDSSTNKATGSRDVEPVTLTLANGTVGDTQIGHWVDAVERLSRGEIRIEVRGGWRSDEVNADRATVQDVREGRVDVGNVPTRAWDQVGVMSLQALDAPMLVDSLALQERVLGAPVAQTMLEGVRSAGVEPVALLPGALRRPVGVTRDLLGPEDYRGALIGMRPSGAHEATMRALGARVTGLAVGEPLAGTDGSEYDLAGVDFDGYDSQARSVTVDVVLWPRTTAVVVNRATWEGLDDAQQSVLGEAAGPALAAGTRDERNFDRGGALALCDRGFNLVRAGERGLEAIRRAVQPVYRRLAQDAVTRDAIEQIRELEAGLPEEPVPSCGDGVAPLPPGAGAEPLVGAWQVRVTFEQIAAARRLPGEAPEDNWGGFTLVFGAGGRFELLNDRYPEPVGFGTWSAQDDVLVLEPSGDVAKGAGETWRYRWTLFRGTLVLDKLGVGPTALTLAPLRRR